MLPHNSFPSNLKLALLGQHDVFVQQFLAGCSLPPGIFVRTAGLLTEILYIRVLLLAALVSKKQAMERTLEGFRGFTSCLSGAEEKSIIYGTGAWNMEGIKESRAMVQAYEMGKEI